MRVFCFDSVLDLNQNIISFFEFHNRLNPCQPKDPMAQIVLGIGTSHTPMLNAPVGDWGKFIERDRIRPHLTREGRPVTYEELERLASPAVTPAAPVPRR